ncbi:MAG: DUF2378 family protein [Myxococcota bacterium]|nr:DUF2378 family protein [Myxococcota bacterium]
MAGDPNAWSEPPWNAPLDADAVIEAVPAHAMINGMFIGAVVAGATARGVAVPSARARYVGFHKYRIREHAQVLVEAARGMWPGLPLRQGLRKLGRATPGALVTSTIGRVVVGSVEGPFEILRGMARSYSIHAQPGSLEIIEAEPRAAVVRMRDVYHFLDSHHIGVFEGALRYAKVSEPRVRIRARSPSDADLLCEWTDG